MAYITKCTWCDGKGFVERCKLCGDVGVFINHDNKPEHCDCKEQEITEKICRVCHGKGTVVESSARYYPKNYPDVLKPIG